MPHAGHCLCGQLHYTVDAEPVGARACWCRDCQYLASGSATVNVLFPDEAVSLSGQVATSLRIADSGNRVERGFCPACGSQIYSRTVEPAGQPIRIRAGTLDNPDLLAPQSLIWVDSAPAWAVLNPALPHYTRGPGSPLAESGAKD